MEKGAALVFTPYQKLVLALLSFLQFTIILDFMILSPLGAMLMPALKITPSQFGLVVSVYAFSAGSAGILAAGFADRFDRKKLLLFFYVGFLFGTLLCAIAPTYQFLLVARMVTGLFGGVIGSIVFAITTDLFDFSQRGRVMGFIQTSFAASQILGIPIGLYMANAWGWNSAFFMIVGVGALAGVVILLKLQPIVGHLALQTKKSPIKHLFQTVATPRYLQAILTTALLSTGGFMLMPFGSAFTVHNLGIDVTKLPQVYLITGLCAMVTGPVVGRISDMLGKYPTFLFGTVVSIVMVLIYTNLGETPLPYVILVSAVMFVGISARMISSQALMSAIPTPASRGAFMSVSSSVQQFSGGIASVLAGAIVAEGEGGRLLHFDLLGYVVIGSSVLTVIMMYFIHLAVRNAASVAPVVAPGH